MTDRKKRKVLESSMSKINSNSIDVIYEKGVLYEEEEAAKKKNNQDSSFERHFSTLKEIFDYVLELKKRNWEKIDSNIAEKQRQASLVFIVLKKINRLEKYQIRSGRDALQKEKQRVDNNRLQLQNLLYEVNHLKREIHRCYQFKSQDEDINLVPEEEFYSKAPPNISRPETTKADEHSKRLARLDWELQQRKELSKLCEELFVLKEKATNDITQQIERLNSFRPCLKSLLKSTKPLQVALEMPMEKEWEISRFIKLLPQPLYMAYVNINSYAAACDSELNVVVEGSEDDARQYDAASRTDPISEDGMGSDTEDVDVKKRKNYFKKCDLEELRRKFLDPYPLFIIISLENKTKTRKLSIYLRFFPLLGFVTASSVIKLDSVEIVDSDIVSSENILNYLYECDDGEKSPIPKTMHQKLDMDEQSCLLYIRDKHFGKPYSWAQKICGIECINLHLNESSETDLEISVPEVMKRIKIRLSSRINLLKQINALENKNIDLYLNSEMLSQVKLSSSLVQWTCIPWEDYAQNIVTKKFIESNLVKTSHTFYRAVVTRGSAKLECFISISLDFPADCPIWALSVSWNGQHNALNNSAIKDMEYWTNRVQQSDIKSKYSMLSFQLARTMCSFDIFLETEGPLYSPSEFSREKNYWKAFSKRSRSRPFQYVENGSVAIFKHL